MKKLFFVLLFLGLFLLIPNNIFADEGTIDPGGCECGGNGWGGCNQNCVDTTFCFGSLDDCTTVNTGYVQCLGPNDCNGGSCSGGNCGAGGNVGCVPINCPYGTKPETNSSGAWIHTTTGCGGKYTTTCGNKVRLSGARCGCTLDEDLGFTCMGLVIIYANCVPICAPSAPSQAVLISPANGTVFDNTNAITLNWTGITNWGKACANANNTYRVVVRNSTGTVLLNSATTSLTANFTPPDNGTYTWYVMTSNGQYMTQSAIWSFSIGGVVAAPTTAWWQVKDGDAGIFPIFWG